MNMAKIFLGFFGCRRTQTLIVFDFVKFHVFAFFPYLIFWNSKESFCLWSLRDFNDWGYKFADKTSYFEERWPKMMDEINQKSFNVRAIMILIRHNQQSAIS
jgi:hypothetical protein